MARRAQFAAFQPLTMAFPIALIVIGVDTRERLRVLGPYLITLALILQASGFGMLVFSRDQSDATWMGLPLAAVFMLAGLWLAPLFVVSWAYPRTFERVVLSRDDLERIRNRDA